MFLSRRSINRSFQPVHRLLPVLTYSIVDTFPVNFARKHRIQITETGNAAVGQAMLVEKREYLVGVVAGLHRHRRAGYDRHHSAVECVGHYPRGVFEP